MNREECLATVEAAHARNERPNLRIADLRNADLSNADLRNADLRDAVFVLGWKIVAI